MPHKRKPRVPAEPRLEHRRALQTAVEVATKAAVAAAQAANAAALAARAVASLYETVAPQVARVLREVQDPDPAATETGTGGLSEGRSELSAEDGQSVIVADMRPPVTIKQWLGEEPGVNEGLLAPPAIAVPLPSVVVAPQLVPVTAAMHLKFSHLSSLEPKNANIFAHLGISRTVEILEAVRVLRECKLKVLQEPQEAALGVLEPLLGYPFPVPGTSNLRCLICAKSKELVFNSRRQWGDHIVSVQHGKYYVKLHEDPFMRPAMACYQTTGSSSPPTSLAGVQIAADGEVGLMAEEVPLLSTVTKEQSVDDNAGDGGMFEGVVHV